MSATDKPKLDRDHVLSLLGQMIRVRKFEDKCAELYTQEKIRGFLHLYDGEEARSNQGQAWRVNSNDNVTETGLFPQMIMLPSMSPPFQGFLPFGSQLGRRGAVPVAPRVG